MGLFSYSSERNSLNQAVVDLKQEIADLKAEREAQKKQTALLKDYEVSISETHHSRKKDAPSGTALRLARIVMEARRGSEPAIVSQRIGDVVGDHTVTLAGPCERLELTHRAQSRDVFARGALRAALWVSGKRPGLYDMPDLFAAK